MEDWDFIRRKMVEKKPPFRATVQVRNVGVPRSLQIIHDGDEVWLIIEGSRIELSVTPTRALLFGPTESRLVDGDHLCSYTWLKAMFDGHRVSYLQEAVAREIGLSEVSGRPCWGVAVTGLHLDAPHRLVRLEIDREFGFVLRTTAEDGGPIAEVQVLEVPALTP